MRLFFRPAYLPIYVRVYLPTLSLLPSRPSTLSRTRLGPRRTCLLTTYTYLLGLREVFLAFGVVDASRPVLSAQLHRGGSVALWPGGATEVGYPSPSSHPNH